MANSPEVEPPNPAPTPAPNRHEVSGTEPEASTFRHRLRRLLFGDPRSVRDPHVFQKVSLVAFLAWVGLGADGLSSSAYGPAEAFKALRDPHLGDHTYLAIGLAFATALTVFVISYAYSRIVEQFPFGGGGYVVATKLLGPRAGVVSGSALIVDGIIEPMELAHLPYKKGRTYEDYVGLAGLKRLGKKKWRRHVGDIIERLKSALQADYVVLGGGNAKLLTKLPRNTRLGNNSNAFLGGYRLWQKPNSFLPRPVQGDEVLKQKCKK